MKRAALFSFFVLATFACSDDEVRLNGTSSGEPSQDGGTTQKDGAVVDEGGVVPVKTVGALDKSWTNPNGNVLSLAIASDGKVLVAGPSNTYAKVDRSKIALLNTDGTADPTLVPVPTETNNTIVATVLLPDGKVVIGGNFNSPGMSRIARLLADGKRDTTFNAAGKGSEGSVSALLRQPDGKILVSGYLTAYNDTPRSRIARINDDGSLDTTFNPGQGAGPVVGPIVRALALQPDGKILIGGDFETFDGTARKSLARLNANGSLDASFVPGAGSNEGGSVNAIVVQSDGKIVIGGAFTKAAGASSNYLMRLNPDGSVDASYKTPFAVEDGVLRGLTALALQSDGKVCVGGSFGIINLPGRVNVARFNTDGSLDSSYAPPNEMLQTLGVSVLLLQPDGKLLVGGDGGVLRFN